MVPGQSSACLHNVPVSVLSRSISEHTMSSPATPRNARARVPAEKVDAPHSPLVRGHVDAVEEVWGSSAPDSIQTQLWITWLQKSARESSTCCGFSVS